MEIWVFGNPDLAQDSLPLRLLPRLRQTFPDTTFVIQDPLDEWKLPDHLYIIDTVVGLQNVTVFDSLDEFQPAPHVTMHDFDLHSQLHFLKKLGKLPPVTIFGIPTTMEEEPTYKELEYLLRKNIHSLHNQ